MPVDPVRDAAIDVLLRVFEKDVHIATAVDKTLRRRGGRMSGRGRRFMTQLVYGTTRHYALADHALRPLLHQPIEKLPISIHLILRMGVFQALFADNVTFPAMVHTSVDLAKRRGHAGTARLVNAVLKRVPQTLDQLSLPNPADAPGEYLHIRYSLPPWLAQRWIDEFGFEQAERICAATNTEAPHTLRVNRLQTSPETLQRDLFKSGTVMREHPDVPDCLVRVEGPIPLTGKVFQRGDFYIQDPASMLAAHLLDPQPGELLFDACSAPGGKTTHLAELSDGQAIIVAGEQQPHKMRRFRENLDRLHTPNVALVGADALHPPFGASRFGAVLLDAPCSGLGTLRRRPDLKRRIQEDAIERLADQQRRLLRSAVALCKNGGRIVYAVCTFTPEETQGVVEAVTGDGDVDFEDGPQWLDQWKIHPGQYRILPTTEGLDGYFLTRLRKRS